MSAVEQLVHDLCVNLEDQVRAYTRLLELSQSQMQALMVKDVQSVHAILQEVEVAMLDRSRAEHARGRMVDAIAGTLGIPAAEVTRSLLQELSSEPVGAALERAAEELRALAQELDGVVAKNRALLEYELSVIDSLVKGMTVDRGHMPTYQSAGMQTEAPRLRLLDAQV